jgi:hypothetical protein
MPRNAAGQTPGDVARSGDASNKTKPKSTPLPSTSGGGVTPSKIISDAQRKLKEKGATAGKPPVKKPTTPPKPPIKPASKKPEQRDTRFDAF